MTFQRKYHTQNTLKTRVKVCPTFPQVNDLDIKVCPTQYAQQYAQLAF